MNRIGIQDGIIGEMTGKSVKENHEDNLKNDEEYSDTKNLRGERYANIISHMDLLWHSDGGPDGCRKCTMYEKILTEAFDKICSMSFRGDELRQDFSSVSRDDIEDELDYLGMDKDRTDNEYIEDSYVNVIKTTELTAKGFKETNRRLNRLEEVLSCVINVLDKPKETWLIRMANELYEEQAAAKGDQDE